MYAKVITTKDGSKSLYLPEMNETYHSKFGALTESEHVYIKAGLDAININKINLLEIGFGTGLNTFLSHNAIQNKPVKIYYEALEKYPLTSELIPLLNTFDSLSQRKLFENIHQVAWQQPVPLSPNFILFKNKVDLKDYKSDHLFDLVYFDAFAPDKQPELWTEQIFNKIFNLMNPKGILVTYSAKGSVRRKLQKVGFTVEKLPGPPGKREMLRAIKVLP